MRARRRFALGTALVAVLSAATLVVSGCTPPSPVVKGSHLTIGWVGSFTSSHATTLEGDSSGNEAIAYLTGSRFAEYGTDGALVMHDDFGTVKIASEDPLRVTYTVRDGVTWSDGAPVDASDLLLAWAAHSGALTTVKPERGADGAITNQEAVQNGVYFDAGDSGWPLRHVSETPKVGDDGRSLTLAFDDPVSELGLVFPQLVAAHVVMRHTLSDRKLPVDEAKHELMQAIQHDDEQALARISSTWSSGFELSGAPKDASLTLSSGPYVIESFSESKVTLLANPDFTWGPLPRVERVTVKFFDTVEKEVAALKAGTIDVLQTEATPVLLGEHRPAGSQARIAAGAEFDHLDLTIGNGGPFDKGSYGGDAAKALAVRQAFLATVPRRQLLDVIVAPLHPDAVLRDSFTLPPGAPGYTRAAKAADLPTTADIERAKALLAQAGVAAPVTVRILYPADDPRRSSEFEYIARSAAQAGFTVIDGSSPQWLDVLGDGSYDAALFAWEPDSLSVASVASVYASEGTRNLNGFSDDQADELLVSLSAEHDESKRGALFAKLDERLAAEAYGLPLFQLPTVVLTAREAAQRVPGIEPGSLPPYLLSGYAGWKPKAAD